MDRVAQWIERARYGEALIATDFDGTLVEIAPRPHQVELDERSRTALRRIAHAPRTHLAIVSGRTLADVGSHVGGVGPVWIASDHGSVVVDPEKRAHKFEPAKEPRLAELRARAEEVARVFRGAHVEVKPLSIALHYREVQESKHDALIEMFRLSCSTHGARVLVGRKVIEGRFGAGDKGLALEYIASRLPRDTSVIYVGDDTTDEPALAYAHAHPRGLALHVSSEERAESRVPVHGSLAGPRKWLEILETIAHSRHP